MPCWVDVYIGDPSRGKIGALQMGQIGTFRRRPEYKSTD